jgi:hypothetical protein
MASASQKRSPATARRARKQPIPRFIAAVRFADGHTQCFSVDNALDHTDARRMVFDELSDVASVVISNYR